MSETFLSPAPVKKRGLPWWAWLLIVLPVVVVLGFVALTVVGFAAYVNHSIRETSPDQPFIEGPAQRPDAKAPLACPDQCFQLDAATLLAVSADDLSPLAIADELNPVGKFEATTVSAVAPGVGEQWVAVGGDAQCSFVISNAPYIAAGSDNASEDPILWIQTWETGDEMTDLAARVFPTTEDASAFMRDIHTRVANCPYQDLDIPTAGGLDTSLVQITAQAAIEVPDEVAAVGWVREGTPGPRWRSYVWDLQRANLVAQVRVLTDGRILEQDVASYAELMAERLADLDATAP